MQGIKSFIFQPHFHATRSRDHQLKKKYVQKFTKRATCMLQGNLVSKTACLQELRGIFTSSLISMLVSLGENFKPQ